MSECVNRVLSEQEAPLESFHDCHVQGIGWSADTFSLWLDLDYIVEWLAPTQPESHYRFRVAKAKLLFANVDDVSIALDWERSSLRAQIETIVAAESRSTPSGMVQRRYEIELAEPAGSVALWSTAYSVVLAHEPVETHSQRLADDPRP